MLTGRGGRPSAEGTQAAVPVTGTGVTWLSTGMAGRTAGRREQGAAGARVRVSQDAQKEYMCTCRIYIMEAERPTGPQLASWSPAQPEGGRPIGQVRGLLAQPFVLLRPPTGGPRLPTPGRAVCLTGQMLMSPRDAQRTGEPRVTFTECLGTPGPVDWAR